MSADRKRADELLEMWSGATARPAPAFVAPATRRRSIGARQWAAISLIAILLALVGLLALAGGSSVPPTPPAPSAPVATANLTPAPSPAEPTFPATVDGLTVQTVSELLAARAAGHAPGGPYALRGYWTDRQFGHSCAAPHGGQPGELELYCGDGEFGITERDEPIRDLVIHRQANETQVNSGPGPAGPHLTPWVPSITAMEPLFLLPLTNDLFWPPVPIVVTGHFDDPKAADCREEAQKLCRDRFVLERIVEFDPTSVPAPTPSPTPTPFPVADPPPALFTSDACYQGVPKEFSGWIPFDSLNIQMSGPGYVYAMVTRDVIAIGEWWENPSYPGHKTRWWGQGVCFALDEGGTTFASVTGTTYLEVDDGRHIVGRAP